jgi:hypothetical protein
MSAGGFVVFIGRFERERFEQHIRKLLRGVDVERLAD